MSTTQTFEDLALPEGVLTGLRQMGYTRPTPVQAAAIPEVLKGKDLMVQAKTGSGKTLAFGLPVLARLDPASPDTQVLVIVPTRELAIQVADEINRVGGHLGVLVSAIYGGTKMDGQMTDLAWSSIIVGTPGRLRDHLTRGNLHLEKCTTVVLDEADEMLDMGFKDDLEFILQGLPQPRVTLLFSATFPKQIEAIARKYMRSPEKIAVSSGLTTPVDIAHRVLRVSEPKRIDALIALIERERPTLGLVFCKRKGETSTVARKLKAAGIRATYLNGDMNQAQRIASLDQFKRGEANILVATDVAARGLDISGVSHVFNVSVPQDTETYVHRSGRTGRAGNKGICVTLVTPEEDRYFKKIQQDLDEGARRAAAVAEPTPAPVRRDPETRRPRPEAVEERAPRREEAPRRPEPRRDAVRREDERLSRPERASERSPERPTSREARVPMSRVQAEAILREANGQAEVFRAIAQELLRQAEPEKLVAALLSQTVVGRKMLEGSRARDEEPATPRRHGRSRSQSSQMRSSRKPSQVVYGE